MNLDEPRPHWDSLEDHGPSPLGSLLETADFSLEEVAQDLAEPEGQPSALPG